jgi:hypothetical protein
LIDRFALPWSVDARERDVGRYQRLLAARQQDPVEVAPAYWGAQGLVLSLDGLQPEKGHETLSVVRELTQKRVGFAAALVSSSVVEVRRLRARARAWAERLELLVRCGISDQQDAFVTGIAAAFAGVPHRSGSNHFLRDLAKPVLAGDSHAKGPMRKQVRGLRAIAREVLAEQAARVTAAAPADRVPADTRPAAAAAAPGAADVVLDYGAAVRGILHTNQGGPLQPPGARMAEALTDVRQSLPRNLQAHKGGPRRNA